MTTLKSFNRFLLISFFAIFLTLTGCKSTNAKQVQDKQLSFSNQIKTDILDSGLTCFFQHNEEPKNRITLRMVVKTGSCMEEENQKGVAHFIEHLAFNGTKNFPNHSFIDYYEKNGMTYGRDFNAHTSYERTVFEIEIPADNSEIIENSLLYLHDIIGNISFEQEEIDKERGVIVEEWRLKQGISNRIDKTRRSFIMADSRYEQRIVIGDMDIIQNITRDEILEFYQKWYKPENISLIVVGDLPVKTMEATVHKIMNDIPASQEKTSVPTFTIPLKDEKDICIFQDDEQKYPIIYIYSNCPEFYPITTEENMKESIIENLVFSIYNQRLKEITTSPDSNWLEAAIGIHNLTSKDRFPYLALIPKTDLFKQSFKSFLDEYDRILTFGVTESELQRYKDSLISEIEVQYKNKDKINSVYHANLLINYFLLNETVISQEDDYNISKKLIDEITLKDVNNYLGELIPNRGNKMFLTVPNNLADLPSKDELFEIWENYSNKNIVPYEDDVSDDKLMEKPEQKGEIISKSDIPELKATQYIFENGVRIITKKTDFETQIINMNGYSKGGLALIQDEDIPSAEVCVNYVILSGLGDSSYNQLVKKTSAKQVDLDINIYDANESFSGSCAVEDFECMLQQIYLFFTAPRFEADAWDAMMQDYTEVAKNHGVQPKDLFSDKVMELLYNDIRHAPFDLSYVEKINPETAEKVFRQRFNNPADFTFTFVGDFDENQLLDICASYLGTLPTSQQLDKSNNLYYPFPEGIITETVKKGHEEKASVFICFGGDLSPAKDIEELYYDKLMINQLQAFLNIRLTEIIREDKSGSYGIGAGAFITNCDSGRTFKVTIQFGCEPSRIDELTEEIMNQINILQSEPISSEYVDKLRESYSRNYENALRSNDWWISKINEEIVLEREPLWVSNNSQKVPSWITSESLQGLIQKYMNTDNNISVFLVPEK